MSGECLLGQTGRGGTLWVVPDSGRESDQSTQGSVSDRARFDLSGCEAGWGVPVATQSNGRIHLLTDIHCTP